MNAPYKLRIEIKNHLPKSVNVSLRAHYHKRHAQNKLWDLLVQVECIGKLPPKPLTSARIRLVRHAHRTLDFDGLVGSMKPVVDSLVSAGVLVDDSWKVTGTWDVTQEYRALKLGTVLEIEVTES